jgi:hypothetical protein
MNASRQFTHGDAAVTRIRAAYESLREQMVEPGPYAQWELGLAVLRCRGLAAWIDACWSQVSPMVGGGPDHEAAETVVPAGVKGEVVMVLASMVLHTVSVTVTYGE